MAKRYQRGNQKPDIKDRHVIQWPKDTKGRKNKEKLGKEQGEIISDHVISDTMAIESTAISVMIFYNTVKVKY
jgi:hypothetical protein